MSIISSLGVQTSSAERLSKQQQTMSTLNEQLASGVKSTNLTDYTSTEAKNIVDLDAQLKRKEAYQDVAKLVDTRISVYDQSLTGIESIASQAVSLCSTSAAYNSETNGTTTATVSSYLEDVEYYLNQEVGGRFLFAGSRFTTKPVIGLATMATLSTTSTTTLTTSPYLPEYDTGYVTATSTSAQAFTNDQVSVDTTTKLTYGVSSDETGFQEVILGLRYAYAATQDSTNYSALMSTAQTYIQDGLNDVQAIHANLSAKSSSLGKIVDRLTTDVSNIDNQISDIQSVDTNEVSVKITSLETQMQASYSATSKLLGLSIVNYL